MVEDSPAAAADPGQLLHASGIGRGRAGLRSDGTPPVAAGKASVMYFIILVLGQFLLDMFLVVLILFMILCHKIFTRIKEGKEICDYFYLFALNVFRRMQSVNALGNKF